MKSRSGKLRKKQRIGLTPSNSPMSPHGIKEHHRQNGQPQQEHSPSLSKVIAHNTSIKGNAQTTRTVERIMKGRCIQEEKVKRAKEKVKETGRERTTTSNVTNVVRKAIRHQNVDLPPRNQGPRTDLHPEIPNQKEKEREIGRSQSQDSNKGKGKGEKGKGKKCKICGRENHVTADCRDKPPVCQGHYKTDCKTPNCKKYHPPVCFYWEKGTCQKADCLFLHRTTKWVNAKPAAPAPFEKARPDSPAPTKAQQEAKEKKAAANKEKHAAAKARKKAATGAVAIAMTDATPDGASPLNR